MEEFSLKDVLLYYFLHGILFSVSLLFLGIIWAVIFVVLVVAGLFIGFIIGLIALFFLIGGLNAFLTDLLWSVSVKSDWKSLIVHGFALFFLLLIAQIPSVIVNLTAPNIAVILVMFIVYCFIDGFIAKSVGGWFQQE